LNVIATAKNGALQVTWTTAQQSNQSLDQALALTAPSVLTATINISAGTDSLFYGYAIKSGASWLTASPAPLVPPGVQTPGAINITASAKGLTPSAQPYQGRIDVFDSANNVTSVNITLLVTADPSSGANQTISHIAYGGGWQTSIVLVNLDSVPAQYSINFWNESGSLTAVPLGAGSASAGTIQPGFSQTIETAALAADPLQEGWAEVVSSQQIGGTAIFSETRSHQEAAVPLLNTGSIKLLIPFDVGGAMALGIGLANPSLDADAQISLTMRTEQGSTIPLTITDANNKFSSSAVSSLTLPKHSHRAILARPLNAAGELRGIVELNSNVPIYGLGIRFNGLAFTSIDAVTPSPAATRTIPHLAFGGGWQTTIIPVNTDTFAAPYSINFWNEDGTPASVPLTGGAIPSGTIQPGFSQTLETAALPADFLRQGWAELSSTRQIGGTAIFRQSQTSQEAAIPLLSGSSTRLLIPFDVGGAMALGIGLANPDPSNGAQITLTMRTEQGAVIPMTITDANNNFSPTAVSSLSLAKRSHRAILAKPLESTGEVRGVIELNANIPVYALGIRFNGLAFTSIRALSK
jgi:predicted secreted protein